MMTFNQRTALRIGAVSVLLAAIASPLAWFAARENAENEIVALAMEESRRLLTPAATSPNGDARAAAQRAAATLTGGLFDIAELYDPQGQKLAEAQTPLGAAVEDQLPEHGRPAYTRATYESRHLTDGRWVLRVFVPLRADPDAVDSPVSGYFEGVRVVPRWQEAQMRRDALLAALMVSLAALLCGAVIYPVVVHLSADNARKAREVLDSHLSMMEALGRAIARRDSDTGAHNFRVAWIAARIAERLGLRDSAMQSLIVGSFLHDVGKIGIPDAILLKPARLDPEEFAIMRTHVSLGGEIVHGIGWLEGASAVVNGHHEKWDGSGYPQGLAGEAIPLAARIFAVADVFDALCSKRPYKAPLPFADVMRLIEADAGRHFDPQVIAAFRPIAADIHRRLEHCSEDECRALLEQTVREHFGL